MCIWVYNDFDAAIKNLPEKVNERGRYTVGYARLCMMKHFLTEGDYMDKYY
ncbi:hypothetical protein [Bacteroides sp.]|uniref:hypothetical protein n=1 Tax=Bacteroides sp. TaxID=29523 RepID=UPI002607F124|nr:hypothetical protein [Bacteroides sp.]MDD3036384.1 hypothetical protein [Bacteroides sp.]